MRKTLHEHNSLGSPANNVLTYLVPIFIFFNIKNNKIDIAVSLTQ